MINLRILSSISKHSSACITVMICGAAKAHTSLLNRHIKGYFGSPFDNGLAPKNFMPFSTRKQLSLEDEKHLKTLS